MNWNNSQLSQDKVWLIKTPYKLSKGKLSTAKTRAAAFDACMKNKKCVGFTRTKKGEQNIILWLFQNKISPDWYD